MLKSHFISILAALLCMPSLASAADAAPPPKLNKAQLLVFYHDHLKGVPKGSLLDYGFESMTKDAESFTDHIEIKVTDVVDESKRDMEFNFLTGDHHIDFSPAKSYRGNPVIIHFLERDISLMAKDTGGSNGYFRNRIRDSFKVPDKVRDVTFELNGKTVNGIEVIVTPFVADRNADKFKLYEHKRYEFVFSDQVPGGIYRIHTQVPEESGDTILIDENMTFNTITPAI
jgi:hypothetical protein